MNTHSKFVGFIFLVVAGLLAGQNARSEVVYDNSSNRLAPYRFAQTTGYEMGDEIMLTTTNLWGYRFITNFVFEYYGSNFNGGEQARLRLYANDGALYGTNGANGLPFYEPGTVLYDSGLFNISATPGTAATLAFNGATLNSKLKGLMVPTNFTWAVSFSGIDSGESAGLTLLNPPVVGRSYEDYWEESGGSWQLRTNNNGDPINFGAYVEAKIDVTKPAPSFVSPIANYGSYANTIDVVGKATDSGSGIALVMYNLGHTVYGTNDYTLITGSNSPNWFVSGVTLQPGTNYFQVKAVDGSGNVGTATRAFRYIVTNQLTLITIGLGTNTPDYNGQYLEINRDYTMTAKPGVNYVFSNWLSSIEVGTTNVASTNFQTKFTFRMQTNMVIVADYETNRFRALSGNYYGLFTDEDTPIVSHERSGLFTLTIKTAQGKLNPFSGKLYVDGNIVGYAGTLDLNGAGTSKPVVRKGKASLQVTVQTTFDGSDSVSGTVYALSNSPNTNVLYPTAFTSAITAFKAGFNLTNNPATNLLGTYTMVLDVPSGSGSPKGNGYTTITVTTNGQVKSVGLMGDYATFKPYVVQMSKDGDWPMFATAYKGMLQYVDKNNVLKTNKELNGMIWGWMKFTNNTGEPTGREMLDGYADWIKYPNTNNFYSSGFTNHDIPVHASAYFMPTNTKSTRIVNITNGEIAFLDGNLTAPFTNTVFFETNNKFAITTVPYNVNTQTLAVVVKTGGVKAKFYHPSGPVVVPMGAVLQDENIARGVFKGTSESGSFVLYGTP